MSEEEIIKNLKAFIDFYYKKTKDEGRKFKMLQVDNVDIKAIERYFRFI